MPVPMSGRRANFLDVIAHGRRTLRRRCPSAAHGRNRSIVATRSHAWIGKPGPPVGYGIRSLVSAERQRARSCYADLRTVSCLRRVPHYRA